MLDVDRLADAVLEGTLALLAKELAPLRAECERLRAENTVLAKRLDEVAAREPRHGRDADLTEVKALIDAAIPAPVTLPDIPALVAAEVQKAADALPRPRDGIDGRDADMGVVQALIAEAVPPPVVLPDIKALVAEAVSALPVPRDGRDGMDGRDADMEQVKAMIEAAIPAPVTLLDIPALIAVEVQKVADTLPLPRDGKDGRDADPARLAEVERGLIRLEERLAAAKAPKVIHGRDGVGIAEAKLNADGELILKLTDGETRNVGRVCGADGVGFDDLAFVQTGERTGELRATKGDVVKSWPVQVPGILDRGVWREGAYEKGDVVTWGGSLWLAQRDTESKPETDDSWRLAVKRGRDGKPGAPPAVPPSRLRPQ